MGPKTTSQAPKPAASTGRFQGKKNIRKAAPKQPLAVPERLKRLFTSLCAQIDGGHFTNAIKTCDKILRLEPKDVDALQTKLFLLLQTEQYTDALSLISSGDGHLFEKAYSFYRMQQEEEAKEIVTTIKEETPDDRGVVHLEAQLSYREGAYQAAFDLYNELLDTAEPQSEEHSDILTNLQASQKHLDFINSDYMRALDTLPTSLTTAIETMPPPMQPTSLVLSSIASSTAPAGASTEDQISKPKKVRASRIPPGVVPGVTPPPDPERWLKKSERSTFGQGRRRKGAGGGGGGATQGSASVETPSPAAPSTTPKGKGKTKKK